MVTILASMTVASVLLGTVGIYKLRQDSVEYPLEADTQDQEAVSIAEKEFKDTLIEIVFLIFLILLMAGLTIWLIILI
jgi:hypothetical protein